MNTAQHLAKEKEMLKIEKGAQKTEVPAIKQQQQQRCGELLQAETSTLASPTSLLSNSIHYRQNNSQQRSPSLASGLH